MRDDIKITHDKDLGLKYRHFTRKTTLEAFYCSKCKKTFISKTGYRTKNLLYLCEECYKQRKEEVKENE